MKILISHPTSNQNNRNTILALKKNNMLHSFITSVNFDTNKFPLNILPKRIKLFLNKRNFNYITKKTHTNSLFLEFFNIIIFKILKKDYANSNYQKIDILTSKFVFKNRDIIDAVYAYEGAALETFRMAKRYNIKCIYELPTVYWRIKHTFTGKKNILYNLIDNKNKLKNKDIELKFADLVIVPSRFAKKTLDKSIIDNKKITILPYGFSKITGFKKRWFNDKKKLKLLYVGRLTKEKGVNYLLKAITELSKTQKDKILFTIIGSGPLENFIKKKFPRVNFKKNLPHELCLKEMRKHDILIFPSLFEGFGLVISEAMSQGMVVISTNRTALPDIGNKDDSVLISPHSSNEIIKKVNYFIRYPKEIKRIGKNAQKTASKYVWTEYHKKLVSILNQTLPS